MTLTLDTSMMSNTLNLPNEAFHDGLNGHSSAVGCEVGGTNVCDVINPKEGTTEEGKSVQSPSSSSEASANTACDYSLDEDATSSTNGLRWNYRNTKLFIGQIPRSMQEDDIRSIFERFGPIYDLHILRDKLTGVHKVCIIMIWMTRHLVYFTSIDRPEAIQLDEPRRSDTSARLYDTANSYSARRVVSAKVSRDPTKVNKTSNEHNHETMFSYPTLQVFVLVLGSTSKFLFLLSVSIRPRYPGGF
ncbi:uncharacterized protein DEA37_0005104 [Paragonimus westermani]|uniref:RRM domain-containing protein n=1 Tax=Paragonimus westermani TaxID=34504 RepID=A0A5J4P1P7_9TREM|nr:uncharacterized protein DEA37_0005104 [Paragonimus westermani]